MIPVVVSERWFANLPERMRPRDASVLASAVLLLATGALAPALITGAAGIFTPLHDLTHGNGLFVCPLCGGTRAFLACCRADFATAAGLNLFAVICWAWTLLQVPLRVGALGVSEDSRMRTFCDRLDAAGMRLFLPLLFGLWIPKLAMTWADC